MKSVMNELRKWGLWWRRSWRYLTAAVFSGVMGSCVVTGLGLAGTRGEPIIVVLALMAGAVGGAYWTRHLLDRGIIKL